MTDVTEQLVAEISEAAWRGEPRTVDDLLAELREEIVRLEARDLEPGAKPS